MDINMNVADHFSSFLVDWEHDQYLLCGGYGSGKSYNVVLKIVLKLMEEKRTALVVRQVRETIRDSCFALFKQILTKMELFSNENTRKTTKKVKCKESPMEVNFPNGSKIIFRGMDNTEKIKSVHGVSIVWIEECSEIRYDAYIELLGRVRENNVSMHFILSCNPVGKENWVYTTFFVRTMNNGRNKVICEEKEFYEKKTIERYVNGMHTLYHHSTLDNNPFLPMSYVVRLNALKYTDPSLWLVARWGRFGANGVRVLPNFTIAKDSYEFVKTVHNIPAQYHFFGLDFGFEESFNALISCCVDDEQKILYIYHEIYVNKITDDRFSNREDVRAVAERANACDKAICADSAEAKTINYYRQQGFNMYGARKYIGSRLQNTKKLKRFRKIVCSPKCPNTIRELQYLTYKTDSRGNAIYDEFNIDPHTFSALWYALDNYTVADLKEIKTNSKAG